MDSQVKGLVNLHVFNILGTLDSEVSNQQDLVLHQFDLVIRIVEVDVGDDVKLDWCVARLEAIDDGS